MAIGIINFYQSDGYFAIANEYLEPDQTFIEEVVSPSFLYPPPTMFLFIPLGWFDIHSALTIWYVLQRCFLVASIIVMWKLFFSQTWIELLVVTATTLGFYGTWSTIQYAQLNFMMLFFVLLFVYDNEYPRAGIWLAPGILVKPLVGVLLIYNIVNKQWKTVITMITTLGLLSFVAIMAFGLETFVTFFIDSPSARYPTWVYLESFFQSLLSLVMKVTNFDLRVRPYFILHLLCPQSCYQFRHWGLSFD